MLIAILQFLGLAIVIVLAGTWLARCADEIAEVTGLGRLLIGSVLLAGATSLPELSVDIAAVRLNLPDLAMGDLLGSSLMNLLILALLDLSDHSQGKMFSRIGAAHALSGLFSISLTGLVGMAILTANRAENWTFLGIHAWAWLIAVGYFLGVRMVFLDQRITMRAIEQAESEQAQIQDGRPHSRRPVWLSLAGFAVAALVILISGPYLASTAGTIAERSGLSNTFVGTTLVALCTSLPELSASYAAIRLRAFDLAIGNVFGSNAFNMLLFLPLDFAFTGTLFAVVNSTHAISAFAAMVATSVVIIGQIYNVEQRTRWCEPDAVMIIIMVILALAIVYYST